MFENTERTVIFSNIDIEMEKGKGPGKRQILPFKTLYKIMAYKGLPEPFGCACGNNKAISGERTLKDTLILSMQINP